MGQDPRTAASVIHLALFGGQLAFAAVAALLERSVAPPEGISPEILLFVTIGVALVSMAASYTVGAVLFRQATEMQTEADRYSAGLRGFIVRMAILEAAGILSIVSYLLTGEIMFFGILAVQLIFFQFRKPSETEWESLQKGSQAPIH